MNRQFAKPRFSLCLFILTAQNFATIFGWIWNVLFLYNRCNLQATIPGFLSKGMSIEEGEKLLQKCVKLAIEARDQFWRNLHRIPNISYNRALVAASIGSYGAYLADGSEYRYNSCEPYNIYFNTFCCWCSSFPAISFDPVPSLFASIIDCWYLHVCSGNYGPSVTLDKLKDFHRRRLQVLLEARPDMLAFETIPNKLEAKVPSFANISHGHSNIIKIDALSFKLIIINILTCTYLRINICCNLSVIFSL